MKSSNLEIKFVIVYKFVEGLNTYGHFFFFLFTLAEDRILGSVFLSSQP